MTVDHDQIVSALTGLDPFRSAEWPPTLDTPELSWLAVAASGWDLARSRALGGREALDQFTAAVAPALESQADVVGTLRAIAEVPSPFARQLSGVLATLLSGAAEELPDAREELLRSAAIAAEHACGDDGITASSAVRLARLHTALDDADGASSAWEAALLCDPLVAWALSGGHDTPDFVPLVGQMAKAPAADGLLAIIGDILQPAHRASGLAALDALAGARNVADPALFLRAAEHLSDGARQPWSSTAAIGEIAAAERLLERITASGPAVELLSAAAAILRGDRGRAREAIARMASDEPSSADEILAGLADQLRRTPDLRTVLREAYFDAAYDPAIAFSAPRGGLATLKRLLLGLCLSATVLGSAPLAPHAAHAQEAPAGATPHDPHAPERTAPTLPILTITLGRGERHRSERAANFEIVLRVPPGAAVPEQVWIHVIGSHAPDVQAIRADRPSHRPNESYWLLPADHPAARGAGIRVIARAGGHGELRHDTVAVLQGRLFVTLPKARIPDSWPRV